MTAYRIADCQYINDLSGKGAALFGGRWNNKDTYMVYTAENAALALLEAVVHIGKIPEKGYCMITLEMPDNSIDVYPVDQLPTDWHQHPPPDLLKKIGDQFIFSNKILALKVPSALMPEANNILINPAHKDFQKVKIIKSRPLNVDERLLHAAGKVKK